MEKTWQESELSVKGSGHLESSAGKGWMESNEGAEKSSLNLKKSAGAKSGNPSGKMDQKRNSKFSFPSQFCDSTKPAKNTALHPNQKEYQQTFGRFLFSKESCQLRNQPLKSCNHFPEIADLIYCNQDIVEWTTWQEKEASKQTALENITGNFPRFPSKLTRSSLKDRVKFAMDKLISQE
eukprot:Sdes_comp10581_c0_seq1m2276